MKAITIPENQFIAWQRGSSPLHLQLAQQYLHHTFLSLWRTVKNVLGGRHAYSHVNALCSAAKAYLVLGNDKYLRLPRTAFYLLRNRVSQPEVGAEMRHSSLASEARYGKLAIASLGDSLARTHWHFETPCGSYAHLKLTRYLLRITKDSSFGDSMERVMYNTILGAKKLHPRRASFLLL